MTSNVPRLLESGVRNVDQRFALMDGQVGVPVKALPTGGRVVVLLLDWKSLRL